MRAIHQFRVVFDVEPEWAPLERLVSLANAQPGIAVPEIESYMYMGCLESDHDNIRLHSYKHVLTRRYLHLDEAGHAYRFFGCANDECTDTFYELLDDLPAAIEWAQGEAEAMRAGTWRPDDVA
jgi:hypothetical protein